MGVLGLFKKKEDENITLPNNDAERWIVGTYAMWSEYAEGDWHYFAGSTKKSGPEGASMRVMLRRDWDVSDKSALLEMVNYLTSKYQGKACAEEEIASGAWNLCRATQLLGMGFVGGYIDREEMIAESFKIGQLMQSLYHSWSDLYDSYLKGYKEWRSSQGDDGQSDIAEREELCLKLKNAPDGPCSLPWQLELK